MHASARRSLGILILTVSAFAALACSKADKQQAPQPRWITDALIVEAKPPGTNALILHVRGYGSGTIATTPDIGLTCWSWEDGLPPDVREFCWSYVPITTASVTIDATADASSRFTGWKAVVCTGATGSSCTVPMNEDRIVEFRWDTVPAPAPSGPFTLSVAVLRGSGSGRITATPDIGLSCSDWEDGLPVSYVQFCSAQMPQTTPATVVVLTADPMLPGDAFAGWGGSCSGNGSCSVTMDRDRGVTAQFAGSSGSSPSTSNFDCGDIVEANIGSLWSYYQQPGTSPNGSSFSTTLSQLQGTGTFRGQYALRANTTAAFDFALIYTAPAPINAFSYEQLRFAIRADNPNHVVISPPWQGNYPVVVMVDAAGARRTYTPQSNLMPFDGTTWAIVAMPLAGGNGWSYSGAIDLTRIVSIEVHSDTWDWNPLVIDLDGMSFEHPQTVCASAGTSSCAPTPAGIAGMWSGEGGGADSVGGHPAVVSGVTFGTGVRGTAFDFVEATDSLVVNDGGALNASGAVSVEAWINPSSLSNSPSGDFMVLGKDHCYSAGWDRNYGLWVRSSSALYLGYLSAGVFQALIGGSVPLNSWTHVAGVIDPIGTHSMSLYVNGALVASGVATAPLVPGAEPLTIGSDRYGCYPFFGRIDEPAVYLGALSATQVRAIYDAGAAGKCQVSPPSIASFVANPSTITSGGSTTLSWSVSGATTVSIDNGVGVVTGSSVVVAPPSDPVSTVTYTLTASNAAGAVTRIVTVNVVQLNSPPDVRAGGDQVASEGEVVTLAGATFLDVDAADTHTAEVDWGDGTRQPAGVVESAGSGTVNASHVYADNGQYAVTVYVQDSSWTPAYALKIVTVTNVAPIVTAGSDVTLSAGVGQQLGGVFRDAGTRDTHVATVEWGDLTQADSCFVGESPMGPPGSTEGTWGTFTAYHAFASPGEYFVTFCVTDDDSAVSCDSLVASVRPP